MPPSAVSAFDADVAVVGGGLAGLTAGVRAAQLGCRVVILEKGGQELYPCNSRYAGGYLHLAFHEPAMEVGELVRSLRAKTPDDIDFTLVETLARNARRTLIWLQQHAGAKFIWGGNERWQRQLLAPPRPPRTSLVWLGRGPDLVLRNLAAAAHHLGARLLRGHEVVNISQRGDGVYVVRCVAGGKGVSLSALAVVLADGGFQANLEDLGRHIAKRPEAVLQRNARTGCGTGMRIARELGAKLTELSGFYGHLLSADAFTNEKLWPYPMVDPLAVAGILVDRAGRRFVDEGRGGVFVTNALARAEDPLGATVVIDASIWETVGRSGRLPCNPMLPALGAAMHRADSLIDLARTAGIDPDGLAETVRTYNAAVMDGRPERLDPGKSKSKIEIRPISQPPYYAIPVCAGITHTMGGVAITPSGAVQRASGGIVPGLFAAGATAGGLEGGRSAFYLGGLCKAAILGLICGESAARHIGRLPADGAVESGTAAGVSG